MPAFALLPLLVLEELRGDVGTQAWLTAAVGTGVGIVCAVMGAAAFLVRPILDMEGRPAGAGAAVPIEAGPEI